MTLNITECQKVSTIKSIIKDSILASSREYYTKEQIECLSNPDDELLRNMISDQNTITCVVYMNNDHIGFGSLNTEHSLITGLYISSEYKNSGYGTKLLSHIENKSKDHNLKGLTVYSSLESKGFYRKKGYEKLQRVTHNMNGTQIPMCVMIKRFEDDYEIPTFVKKNINN